ncbi:hypothetical protein HDU79_003121 [Rhizoclosmatium sp. JEL0117]|nr:hypothetical protein HDU79_003121 [Rhizoclosmatium sp. JEL0117]
MRVLSPTLLGLTRPTTTSFRQLLSNASRIRLLSTATAPKASSFPFLPRSSQPTRLGLRFFATAPKHAFKDNTNAPPPSKLAQLIREYGPLSLVVYAFFSSITFMCCLSSIYFLGVDRKMIMEWVHRAKEMIGLESKDAAAKQKVGEHDSEDASEGGKKSFFDFLPESLKSEAVITLGTNVLLAMVMTKLFLPVKLTLVAFVTPTVARRLRTMGFNFGQKGGYGDAARTVRENIKERRGL